MGLCWRGTLNRLVIECGVTAQAADCDHGEWGELTSQTTGKPLLPFSRQTAQKLMRVAMNQSLSNSAHARHLPASWYTLTVLAALDPDDITFGGTVELLTILDQLIGSMLPVFGVRTPTLTVRRTVQRQINRTFFYKEQNPERLCGSDLTSIFLPERPRGIATVLQPLSNRIGVAVLFGTTHNPARNTG